jgi:hypothetical protein
VNARSRKYDRARVATREPRLYPVPEVLLKETPTATSAREAFAPLLVALAREARVLYGPRLGALVVFGSVGRGTARWDSDIDVLVVADDLPNGRIARVRQFDAVEAALAPDLATARQVGLNTGLSPVFKTPAELATGSPLLLDMVDDALVLHDDGVFAAAIGALGRRLEALGARRVWRGSTWFWDLKPDYRVGETFEL